MIRIDLKPEPAEFHQRVREKGVTYLEANKKVKNYWKHAKQDLIKAYGPFCAYLATRYHTDLNVDHFLPKSKYPHLSYEWENYRLACGSINGIKNNKVIDIDPFKIPKGSVYFTMDFPSMIIKPHNDLPENIFTKVERTIKALDLNREEYANQRFHYLTTLIKYVNEDTEQDFLLQNVPFMAQEIQRQNLSKAILKQKFPFLDTIDGVLT